MTNTSETFWDIDGVSLQTLAFNIVTLGGDRKAPPSLRGEDRVIPYMVGESFEPKIPGSHIISLAGWVIGAGEDGIIPSNEDSRRTFDRNWSKLRKLLWRYRSEFTLTKRFWVPTADLTAAGAASQAIQTQGTWSLISASARASFAGGLSPAMTGPSRAAFTVDLKLSDPYFYSAPLSTTFSMSTPTKTIQVLGDDRTNNITVDFSGPITNPRLTLTDYDGDPWFEYGAALTSGTHAIADVQKFSMTRVVSGGATNPVSGYAAHAGTPYWFFLDTVPTPITLSAASGSGSAVVTYRPAWL